MSNIYIQEPPTNGKVLLKTTVGDIDVELWSKEASRACRNFVQLCMEGYYNDTIFHRVVNNFIVQGGDPGGTGHGGESVYGHTFRDEFHSRLRFVRRGLVAMANSGPHDNGSQFFFTMDSTPELNNKHTIFGKVTGNTLYNMLKLQETETDANERPLYPHKILTSEVLSNPFDDIIPRQIKKNKKEKSEGKKLKSKSKATKNFSLLSFGEEAEEDEVQVDKVLKNMRGKSKSSHDLTDDPRLSATPAVDTKPKEKAPPPPNKRNLAAEEIDNKDAEVVKQDKPVEEECEKSTEIVKKLKKDVEQTKVKEADESQSPYPAAEEKLSKSEELRKEAKKLKKEIMEARQKVKTTSEDNIRRENETKNEVVAEFRKDLEKYKELKRQQGKGVSREELTLSILSKFQSRLQAAKAIAADYSDDEDEGRNEEEDEENINDLSWMRHKLQFDAHSQRVIDANVHDADRYKIYDPRNPITKRRREASKQLTKEK